ncbi:MAG: UDP-N-acetylglucosamine--N-acetylmuramyl-(pentapeptide) pyrophosphoryl-undecaprenol N-acetylglucosamine transferase [Verrucomicrobiaceae bacterium]|nr:UDP-N-acetylglucosamine--N-acetylmuramyl-(pentapeptide) pyrophosphoryl-undecaprenol N-acetylglucosamine transferase [Verrucomicrobiaceae bacterium]
MSKFIIACGGTGGHLVPGIAIGQALISAGHEVSFAITKKQVDSRLVEKYTNLHFIKMPGVAFSKSPIKFLKFLKEFLNAFITGIKLLKSGKYDVVISFGGFNSLGISLAAALLGKPIVLHEANRKTGKATRLLGHFARRVYVPYGVKIPRRKINQVKFAGYPLRDEIQKIKENDAKKVFGFDENANILLVLGGSQGAESLNNWVNENFEKLAFENIDVLCVCGQNKNNYQNRTAISKDGHTRHIKMLEFCDEMASALSASKIVVARAGAGTIAELARCRVPSIMVPYPYAADNHQLENAKCFEKQGACTVVEQKDIDTLLNEVVSLFYNKNLQVAMNKNLERVDEQNDCSKIVEDLTKIAKGE